MRPSQASTYCLCASETLNGFAADLIPRRFLKSGAFVCERREAMNGIHDMGGLHNFGSVVVETDEPVFHHRWEARVFGMVQTLPGNNIDAGRHSLERLDPVAYLVHGYYGRWLAALEQGLLDLGSLAPDEIEVRIRQAGGDGQHGASAKRRDTPQTPAWTPPPARSYVRQVDREPAFHEGQAVRTRNHQPAGHTRLPAYARCRRGTIARVHSAMVYPDDHAHGRGENPQHVYSVRFNGNELWGTSAEPGTAVYLDLFEPYLEPL
jgi:nitrile hydratase subunit beta